MTNAESYRIYETNIPFLRFNACFLGKIILLLIKILKKNKLYKNKKEFSISVQNCNEDSYKVFLVYFKASINSLLIILVK
ncbi:MAG: hypothetical protein QW806_02580 [Nitrososphaerota archaeon]